ncbi:MAG: DinB family protein [Rhodothermales bacterium]|nr:DinB family protein [Rhodothermales bacterium]
MQTQRLIHPHLRQLLADAEHVRAEAERFRRTLSDGQVTWHPEPGAWSVADCFEHLRKVGKAYYPRISEALTRTRPAEDAAFRPSLVARSFFYFSGPEVRFKLRAPKAIRPKAEVDHAGATALDRFLQQQDELLRLIREADGTDLNTGTFASPLAGIVKFTVGEGLTAMVVHQQRHLGQAQRLTEREDFPRA